MALAQKKLDSLKAQYTAAVSERDHHQAIIEPGDAAVTYANLVSEIARWDAVAAALKTVLDTVLDMRAMEVGDEPPGVGRGKGKD